MNNSLKEKYIKELLNLKFNLCPTFNESTTFHFKLYKKIFAKITWFDIKTNTEKYSLYSFKSVFTFIEDGLWIVDKKKIRLKKINKILNNESKII